MSMPNSTELMIAVERIVRPILAPLANKMTMRHELLAHLEEIYAEELAKSSDPSVALQAAQKRLGDPNELRRNLQQTIPAWRRTPYRFERRFFQYPGESNARFAIRSGLVFSVIFTTGLLVAVVPIVLLKGRDPVEWIAEFFVFLGFTSGTVLAAVTWLGLWIVQPEIESSPPPSRLRWQKVVASLAVGLVGSAAATALLIVNNRDPYALSRSALIGFAGGALTFPIICELFILERRQSLAWDRLEIGRTEDTILRSE